MRYFALLPAAAMVSCSGQGGGACLFEACGGDLVGTWTFDRVCVEGAATLPPETTRCEGATLEYEDTMVSGTWSFSAEGTWDMRLHYEGMTRITLPPACVQDRGVTDCSALAIDPGTGCTGDALSTGCSCTAALDEDDDDTGSYTVDGGIATLHADHGGGSLVEYCVAGEGLTLRDPYLEPHLALSGHR